MWFKFQEQKKMFTSEYNPLIKKVNQEYEDRSYNLIKIKWVKLNLSPVNP